VATAVEPNPIVNAGTEKLSHTLSVVRSVGSQSPTRGRGGTATPVERQRGHRRELHSTCIAREVPSPAPCAPMRPNQPPRLRLPPVAPTPAAAAPATASCACHLHPRAKMAKLAPGSEPLRSPLKIMKPKFFQWQRKTKKFSMFFFKTEGRPTKVPCCSSAANGAALLYRWGHGN